MTPWPAGIRVEIHSELDSTSAECARRAAAGDAGPLWILAHKQSNARGRRGRAWVAPEGNFAASLLRPVDGAAESAAQRSFVAALGLYDALTLMTGSPERFSLKWPNDVLLDGRKLAGILLELQGGQGGAPLHLILGIGVNLATSPDPTHLEDRALPPTCLADVAGRVYPSLKLLEFLVPAIEAWEHRLVAEGFTPLRTAWLEHASGLGNRVTARMADRQIEGIFTGLDRRGHIMLETGEGSVSLPAAELKFAVGTEVMEASNATGG